MELIIIGGFSEIFESLEENDYQILGYVDLKKNDNFNNYNWLGTDDDVELLKIKFPQAELIFSPDLPNVRDRLNKTYYDKGFIAHTFVDKRAIVSKSAILKQGVFVQKMAHVSSNCVIGKLVKINVAANIMHDCKVGEYTTIAPNAVVLGNVKIGKHCYIGSNATILPNISIGDYVTVGAGAVVTKSIKSNTIVKGVPAI